jgi:hypothetical protein
MNDHIRQALDERIDWINEVVGRVREDGIEELQKAVLDLPNQHLRSMLFVLMLQRLSDAENLAAYLEGQQQIAQN